MKNVILISAYPEAALRQAGFLVKHLLKNTLVQVAEIHQFSSNIQMEKIDIESAMIQVNGLIRTKQHIQKHNAIKCNIFIDNSIAQNCIISKQLMTMADVVILVDISIEKVTEQPLSLQEDILSKKLLLLCVADKLKWHVTSCNGKTHLDEHIMDCVHAIL